MKIAASMNDPKKKSFFFPSFNIAQQEERILLVSEDILEYISLSLVIKPVPG